MFFWVMTPCRLADRYQRFGKKILSPSSALKMETVCFSETLSTYESTLRHNPDEQHRHLHRRENLKSHKVMRINRRHRGDKPCLLIALMMETANVSATSVNFYQTTRRNIPTLLATGTARHFFFKFGGFLPFDCIYYYN
jgi:hypothetical protein